MFINEEQIKFKDFQSMCRTCLKNNNLKSINNNFLIEVLHNITDINYRIDEELPQNICEACINKIHEIRAFAFQCIEIDITLRKCRNAAEKTNETINKTTENIKQEVSTNDTISFNEIKDVTFDENVIDIDDESKCGNFEKWFQESTDNNYSFAACASNDDEPKCGNFEKWFQKSTDINYSYAACATNDESDAESDNSTNLNIIENEEKPPKKSAKIPVKIPAKIPEKNEFRCEVCNKCFKSMNAYKRHRELFKGPHFCCDVCQQLFTNPSGLKMHKKKHEYIGILFCDVCNKYFYKARALRDHKKKVHRL